MATAMNSKSKAVLDKTARSLDALVTEVRADLANISEPKAQALLETTAEVLLGLKKAYKDYEGGSEDAWK
jgi:hypothetical protein